MNPIVFTQTAILGLLLLLLFDDIIYPSKLTLGAITDDEGTAKNESDDYYYDDYYEDESENTESVTVSSRGDTEADLMLSALEEQWRLQQQMEEADRAAHTFRGYYKNIGGGIVKIRALIDIEGLFLDEAYQCISAAELSGQSTKSPEAANSEDSSGVNMINAQINQARLSIREKQEQKMKQMRAREKEKSQPKPKFRLGATCDRLYCAACTLVVTEFARAVHSKFNDSSVKYVHEVAVDFCQADPVKVTHVDMVADLCQQFEKEAFGYKDALIVPFEQDDNLEDVLNPATLHMKYNQICTSVGACPAEYFDFVSKPLNMYQDHWDDKCFVCQAFAKNLEEQVQLNRYITEGSIVPIVAGTCGRLNLPEPYRALCVPLTEGTMLDDVAWIGKVHVEAVSRMEKAEKRFADSLCEEIRYCEAWKDPIERQEAAAQKTMEEVFE